MGVALSDAELVRQTRAGDREAFGKLVERHRRTIYALCLQRGFQPVESEDLAQETFIRAYRNLDALQDATAFARWLYGIVGHVCADGARTRRRRLSREEPGLDQAPEPEAALEFRAHPGFDEELGEVAAAMHGLTEEHRIVVALRYLEGLSPKEIASRLGEPRGTIRSRLHHALRHLQSALGGARTGEARES